MRCRCSKQGDQLHLEFVWDLLAEIARNSEPAEAFEASSLAFRKHITVGEPSPFGMPSPAGKKTIINTVH